MSDISSIGPGPNGLVGSVNRVAAPTANLSGSGPANRLDPPAAGADAGVDRVELSDFARHLDRLRQMPDVRQNLLERVRAAIADGTYETENKLDTAIQRLAAEELD